MAFTSLRDVRIFVLLLLSISVTLYQCPFAAAMECLSYTLGQNETSVTCPGQETAACIGVFILKNGSLVTQLLDCQKTTTDGFHCSTGVCIADQLESDRLFCCCRGNLCNGNVSFAGTESPVVVTTPRTSTFVTATETVTNSTVTENTSESVIVAVVVSSVIILLLIFGCGVAVFVCLVLGWIKWKNRASHRRTSIQLTPVESSSLVINKHNMIGSGRYSAVYSGTFQGREVAVKVFIRMKDYYHEFGILSNPGLKHPNIVKLLWPTTDLEVLVLELHTRGSLESLLKERVISRDEFALLAETAAGGLSKLHSVFCAHRDLKTTNILINDIGESVIIDFHTAVFLEADDNMDMSEVGTVLYLSPELLSGKIHFNADTLLKADMFAFGIVLSQMLRRTSTGDEDIVTDDYYPPYHEYFMDRSPNINDMISLVSDQGKRPIIHDRFRSPHSGFADIVNSINDCWDSDPISRCSSLQLYNRLTSRQHSPIISSNSSVSLQSAGHDSIIVCNV